jgi:acetyl esterase/lipase
MEGERIASLWGVSDNRVNMRLLAIFPLLLLSIGLVVGCSPMRLVNGVVPEAARARRDIAYGAAPRQRMDLYAPAASASSPAPVVIFFYGGSWQGGAKADYLFVADALTSRGFVAVIPDYRVYPEVKFPAFLEDGAQVVRWTRDHVADFGGDPTRIYLMGHSAGAHIAAMLSLDPRYLKAVGLERSVIRAMVGLAGPYDFLPFHSETLRTLFGPAERWPETQPINFVDGKEPPMLLLSGSWDTTVGPGNARRLIAKICEHGGSARAIFYSGIGHTTLIGAMARPFRLFAPVLDDATEFLRSHG